MPPLPRRYTEAKIAKRCPGCRTSFELGDSIAPRRTPRALTWVCASCDADTDDLAHVLAWLEIALQRRRAPSLSDAEVQTLLLALREQNTPATQRGDRAAWHPARSSTAQFSLPADAHVHGLLRDAREHGFTARLPRGYVSALLEALAPTAP